jgi:hypothetical protein
MVSPWSAPGFAAASRKRPPAPACALGDRGGAGRMLRRKLTEQEAGIGCREGGQIINHATRHLIFNA